MRAAREILDFWFAGNLEAARPVWFRRDEAFDAAIARNFGDLVEPARQGRLDAWASDAEGALALLLLLDQFPRNLFRGRAEAFASDSHARVVARRAVLERRQDLALPPTARSFFYLPFEHGEDMADQNLSVALFEGLRDHAPARAPGGAIDYAWRHWHVIARFGRFPHRNAALSRANTEAETLYLTQPGAGF
ncbi:DUF924 family protein [Pseudoroseomonas wenyumeiae]|uniref:DUF924 domain-containing protein n=1 Tax=Teichococcus wenyumeiae TaxID=2478470 RepID=A0A3A9JG63_9PROT|nr:DUF924 family protein [Pseudoroseomonas wenyumeiae]RKK05572.1 DUF924 domain-containing protein [Pseudoroseomonas wenyumeiae]RMI19958.1 DUF924 family protein [Pseudoroseomonas wenyumeiae]